VKSRSLVPELMDDPRIDPQEHRRALDGLARLNRVSMIERPIWREIYAAHSGEPMRVLDIAAGSGDLVVAMARRAARRALPIRFTGADISETACARIRENARQAGVAIEDETADALDPARANTHDVVMCHLFVHHLPEEQIVRLLEVMRERARRAIVITDLVRSRSGHALALGASRLLTRSRVVHVDAPRSVRAALTPRELGGLARTAGLGDARIRRLWPERMMLTWRAPA